MVRIENYYDFKFGRNIFQKIARILICIAFHWQNFGLKGMLLLLNHVPIFGLTSNDLKATKLPETLLLKRLK